MDISKYRQQVSATSSAGGTNKPSFASENFISEDEECEIYNSLPAKVLYTGTLSSSNNGHTNHFKDSHQASEDLGTTATLIDKSFTPKRRYSITAESSCCRTKKNSPCPECNIF